MPAAPRSARSTPTPPLRPRLAPPALQANGDPTVTHLLCGSGQLREERASTGGVSYATPVPDRDQAASQPPTPPGDDPKARTKRRRMTISLATLVAVVTLATGVLTLKDQILGGNED